MVKILKTKLDKKLRMFTLWKRKHNCCLQIVERISGIKVNRFVLECQRVKFKRRQILAHLCWFFAWFIFYSSVKSPEEDIHYSNPFQQWDSLIWMHFYYISLWLLLKVRLALGKIQIFPKCFLGARNHGSVHIISYITPSLVIWHLCKTKTISMLPLLHTTHKNTLLFFLLKIKQVQEIKCSSCLICIPNLEKDSNTLQLVHNPIFPNVQLGILESTSDIVNCPFNSYSPFFLARKTLVWLDQQCPQPQWVNHTFIP